MLYKPRSDESENMARFYGKGEINLSFKENKTGMPKKKKKKKWL